MFRIGADGDEQYLFETSVYVPMGEWTSGVQNLYGVTRGVQIWGDEIARRRGMHASSGRAHAGGVAVALEGHRGELGFLSGGHANIDVEQMLGSVNSFAADLGRRGLSRVVVVTEHYALSKTKPNLLTLENLNEGFFGSSNEDLYQYLVMLRSLGVEVIVVSGEQRDQRAFETLKGESSIILNQIGNVAN